MVNESKDPSLCHVCDLAPCWSVKSCSYSVVFGFIRISKHKPGNSLQCVFLSFSDWLSCNIQKNNHFLAGNVFNKKKRKKKAASSDVNLSLMDSLWYACVHGRVLALLPFSQHVLTIKIWNLHAVCQLLPHPRTYRHTDAHFLNFFFIPREGERGLQGLKDRLSEPLSAHLHHKRENIGISTISSLITSSSLANWSFRVQLTVTLAQQKIEREKRKKNTVAHSMFFFPPP